MQAVRNHQAGKPRDAERLCRRVLREAPEHAEALNLLGTLAVRAGKADAGIEYIGRASRLRPASPVFHCNLGLAQQAAGKRDAAIASYRQALRIEPDYVDALTNLGGLLLNQGETEAAIAGFRNLVRLAPRNALGHGNLGTALLARGALDEAAACFGEALRRKPDYADAHNGLGAVFLARYRYGDAEASLIEALGHEPRHFRAHNNLGLVRAALGRHEEAVESFHAALSLRPSYAEAHQNLAAVLIELDMPEDAEAAFREVLRLRPGDRQARLSLAKLQSRREEFDAALAAYDEILENDPESDRALIGKARVLQGTGQHGAAGRILRRLAGADNLSPEVAAMFGELARAAGGASGPAVAGEDVVTVLERVLGRPALSERERSMLLFSLGGLHDHLGAFDAAFRCYQEANALRHAPFDGDAVARRTGQQLAYFSAERLARLPRATNRDDLPVFIVGMPRSGTSLVEQILASHPRVAGAGELRLVGAIAKSLSLGTDSGAVVAAPDFAPGSGLDQDLIDRAAASHLERLRTIGGEAARVTDKMPYNFLHLGLISLLFPGARIIHCLRDPMDTCTSCYFQGFRAGNAQTFDLGHLGAFYVQYDRLMRHWRRVLDIPMLEVRYEDHVAEPERTCREMLAFLDLEWDPQCLRFHESSRIVRTASRDQVREPIYTRSVARWRNYERHLGPLKEALAEVL